MKNITTGKTILAVDDMAVNLTAIKKIIQDDGSGYELCMAKSVEEALAALERSQVDLVLLDIEMPEASGFDLFSNMQDNPVFSIIPVIFVTSDGSADIVTKAAKMGAKDYVVKPIKPEILMSKIHRVLSNMQTDPAVEDILTKLGHLKEACLVNDRLKVEELMFKLYPERYITSVNIILNRIQTMLKAGDYEQSAKKIEDLIATLLK